MYKFSDRLQYLIDLKKIEQKDVVEGVGLDKAQVSNWLSGKVTTPRRSTIHKLAYFFECDIEWLASGKGEPYPKNDKNPMSITGDSNIQAGGTISGIINSGKTEKQIELDQDEFELIKELREVGGKMMIKRFRKELSKLKKIIEEGET